MAEQTIKPDLKFVKEIINSGGESLKKCFQCATCTVVCNVTPDDKPFPRKEMLHAQWGLKDKLFGNPDIWLCHQCSDCTAHCPRGAKPGEVLGAIRKMSLQEYSAPGFLAKMVGDIKFLPLLVAIPLAIFLIIVGSLGNLDMNNIPRGEDGGIVYAKFIPVPYIDAVFIIAFFFGAIMLIKGALKYWNDLSKSSGKASGSFVSATIETVKEILLHNRFKKCTVTESRSTSHMFVLFSFIGLAVTTTLAIIYLYGYEWFGIQPGTLGLSFGESPYPLTDPMKLLGNASALALLIGITLVILNRMANAEKAGMGSYYDWLFIGVVTSIVVTGILSEVLRLANVPAIAYPTYLIHLTSVFFLFAYAPFSKMAHMVYRTTAMVFSRQSGRE